MNDTSITRNTCNRAGLAGLIVILAWTGTYAPPADAALGPLIRQAARKVSAYVTRAGGRKGTRELARHVGRNGAEELLERACREGGETAAEHVVHIAQRQGVRGVTAVAPSPALLSRAIHALPDHQWTGAVNALHRNPTLMREAVEKYGANALAAEVAHPGLGARLALQFGDDALRLGRQLDTDQMIRFARHADAINTLPVGPRTALLDLLGKFPARVLDTLEAHPKILQACTKLGVTGIVVGGAVHTGKYALRGHIETTEPDGTVTREQGPITLDASKGCGLGIQWALPLLCAGLVLLGWQWLRLHERRIAARQPVSGPNAPGPVNR